MTRSMRKPSEGKGHGNQTDQDQARLPARAHEIEGLMHAQHAGGRLA